MKCFHNFRNVKLSFMLYAKSVGWCAFLSFFDLLTHPLLHILRVKLILYFNFHVLLLPPGILAISFKIRVKLIFPLLLLLHQKIYARFAWKWLYFPLLLPQTNNISSSSKILICVLLKLFYQKHNTFNFSSKECLKYFIKQTIQINLKSRKSGA